MRAQGFVTSAAMAGVSESDIARGTRRRTPARPTVFAAQSGRSGV
jgi:hypothetical protein